MARKASLSFTGAGSVGEFDTMAWSVQEDVTPHVPGRPAGSTGSASWRAGTNTDSAFIKNNVAVFGVEGSSASPAEKTIVGRINDVAPGATSVRVTQGTSLSEFVAERAIPAVSSGSAVGALDLCMSLAGNAAIPSATVPSTLAGMQFWTLNGHDVGFDYNNNPLTPQDQSTISLSYNNATGLIDLPVLSERVVDYANAHAWTAIGTSFYANGLTGSSPYPVSGEAQVIRFDAMLNGANLSYLLNTGPENTNLGTGITASVVIDYAAATLTVSGDYLPGGIPTSFITTSSIATLNKNTSLSVAIYFGWTDSTHFTLEAKVANTSALSTVVTASSGSLAVNIDTFSEPYIITGYIKNLYQVRVAAGYNYETNILTGMGNAQTGFSTSSISNAQLLGMLDNPINGYVGTMWEYLNQVAAATGWEYRVDTQTALSTITPGADMTPLGALTMTLDDYAGTPSVSIGSAGAAQNVDVVYQNTTLTTAGQIYDAFTTGETWSVGAGEIKTVTIQTDSTITLAQNPMPYSTIVEFDTATLTGGAYLVSGSDNLPIPAEEWIAYGGSVSIESSGVKQINVVFTGPPTEIPGVPGPYSFAVSDGSTTYPTLVIFGSGTSSAPQTFTFPTGADSTLTSVISAGTINNPAVSSMSRVYAASMWAGAFACSDMTLNASVDVDRFFAGGVIGFISGTVFTYRNMKWRVMNSTIGSMMVNITAVPYTTVGDIDSAWTGQTYATMQAVWPSATYNHEDFILEPVRTS